ncbi:hypothetical protein GCM10010873_25570 [Cypionkella aquatica]|uniref:Uncharacterized protein n=1 Tax=Cypionkella aquatica TaxID=1756042 RepID=A0AA37TU45_9RHOB|nr:hypothetical protein GCM10010873_25570 [Cypionkella aquatica]
MIKGFTDPNRALWHRNIICRRRYHVLSRYFPHTRIDMGSKAKIMWVSVQFYTVVA